MSMMILGLMFSILGMFLFPEGIKSFGWWGFIVATPICLGIMYA